jgi:hypothetical protein
MGAACSWMPSVPEGKDVELRQMAKFLAQKAKDTGLDQQLGPLNPYERRIVHLAVQKSQALPLKASATRFRKPFTSQRGNRRARGRASRVRTCSH